MINKISTAPRNLGITQMKYYRLSLRILFVSMCVLCMCLVNACTRNLLYAEKEKSLESWGGMPTIWSTKSDGTTTYLYKRLATTGASVSGTGGVVRGPAQKTEFFCYHFIVVNPQGEIVDHFTTGTKVTSRDSGAIVMPALEEPYPRLKCSLQVP